MSDLKPIRVAATIFYAKDMTVLNKTFDETNDKYVCTLGELSDRACEALQALGIKIKTKEGPGKYVASKSKYIFEPVNEDGEKIDAKKLGNGSKVVALITPYQHKMSGKHGMGVRIQKLIVTDWKVYGPQAATQEDNTEAL